MGSYRDKNQTSSRSAQRKIITYRYNGKMTYVCLAPSFAEAVALAQSDVEGLAGISANRITFSLTVVTGNNHQSVGISPSAWPQMSAHLTRYEIIDIHVTPNVVITTVDASEAAPPYQGPSGLGLDFNEKSPSCPYHQTSQSQPPSPTLSIGKLSPKRLFRRLASSLDS
ncbi:hypothetical protein HYDPIDRAFT_109926 [Hydnomerulius pinastri MD-312]|nr:hypothetical protein HYDPIDRAFT_109926 [Hydnomerulius pinastri MD-312]